MVKGSLAASIAGALFSSESSLCQHRHYRFASLIFTHLPSLSLLFHLLVFFLHSLFLICAQTIFLSLALFSKGRVFFTFTFSFYIFSSSWLKHCSAHFFFDPKNCSHNFLSPSLLFFNFHSFIFFYLSGIKTLLLSVPFFSSSSHSPFVCKP